MPTTLALSSLIPPGWQKPLHDVVESPAFAELSAFLDAEVAAKKTLFPPRELIFAALAETPLDQVKAVVIGQDPYPTAGNANGLSFSVSPGVKVPGSLRNIFAALQADTGLPVPKSGDLSPWAKSGVLLLNTVLTVREGEANSHQGHGWEAFTEGVLRLVNAQPGPIAFLCFGKQAHALAAELVDAKRHKVFNEPHPSPLNGKKFVESVKVSKIFTKTNEVLKAAGRDPIDWALP